MIIKFENFINDLDKSKYDKSTILYLENKITFDDWKIELYNINESNVNNFINNKILPVLKTIKDKIKNVGIKGIKIIKQIFKAIIKFFSKYPVLRIVLILMILMFVIGIVTASAATGTDPNTLIPDERVLNAAIGFIQEMYEDGSITDVLDKMKVQAYLIDLRNDGVMDNNWGEEIKKMGDVAIKIMDDSKDEHSDIIDKLSKFGENFKDYIFNEFKQSLDGKGTSKTEIKLIYK